MNGIYTVYKRELDGTQGDLIAEFTCLDIDLKWSKLSKWTLDGVTSENVPFADGDPVLIYRNGKFFLGGITQEMRCECPNPSAGVKYWTANGSEDSLMFSWRQALADPAELTFNNDVFDQIEDSAYNRIVYYLYENIGQGTTPERRFSDNLRLPGKSDKGTAGLSAYKSKPLDKVLAEIGKEDELYPELIRSDHTGEYRVRIKEARDMTEEIVISPDYGNVTEWTRRESMPEFNAVWVVSGDYSKGRLYVYAEDIESIRKYGRIETIVSRSDVAPYDEPEEEAAQDEKIAADDAPDEEVPAEGESEETDTGADDSYEETEPEDEAKLSEADVISILEQEAKNQLKEHGPKRTWEIKASETHSMAFMDDWQIGDRVTCAIDGERFESQITEVKITYKEGIETVEPTIGDIERGLFGKIFDLIDVLDDRITNKENE